jgi:Uma2 family endonuclease
VQKHVERPATYDDLLRVPDHLVAEIVDGELYTNPRPAMPHAAAAGALFGDLYPAFHRGREGPGGWWIVFEPELHLGEDVLVPDLAGWRRERMPALPTGPWVDVAPDWICEALSPGTARLDRFKKLPAYAREQVQFAWIIDANLQSFEAFRLENGRWTYIAQHVGNEVIRVEPFQAVEIDLANLWEATPQPPQS